MADTFYHFNPILRRGLAGRLATQTSGPRWRFPVKVTIANEKSGEIKREKEISQEFELFGPGDIVGYDQNIHVRHYPTAFNNEVEVNYFPFIEFREPDFLWAYTAKQMNQSHNGNKVLPWLTLIVLKAKDGSESGEYDPEKLVKSQQNGPGRVSVVNASLPALEEAWRWAHVQTVGEENFDWDNLSALNESERSSIKCRLMCPRKLEAQKKYGAFLVPTFMLGVQAGGGTPPVSPSENENITALTLAWNKDSIESANCSLPFYYHWEFRTGKRGDFESLVRRLKPREFYGLGKRLLDLRKPGFTALNGKLNNPLTVKNQDGQTVNPSDYIHREGVFVGLKENQGSIFDPWGKDNKENRNNLNEFQKILRTLLNKGENGDELRLVPPVYGKWHARKTQLSESNENWLEHLNLDPRHRYAAALGAQYVKDNQEKLMIQAYDQLGKVEDLNAQVLLYAYGAKAMVAGLERMELVGPAERLNYYTLLGNRLLTRKGENGAKLTVSTRMQNSNLPTGFFNSSSSKFFNKDRFWVKEASPLPVATWLVKSNSVAGSFNFIPQGVGVASFASFQDTVQSEWLAAERSGTIQGVFWSGVLNRADTSLNADGPPSASPWYGNQIAAISANGLSLINERPKVKFIIDSNYAMTLTKVENVTSKGGNNVFVQLDESRNAGRIRGLSINNRAIVIDEKSSFEGKFSNASSVSFEPQGGKKVSKNIDVSQNQTVLISISSSPPGTIQAGLIDRATGLYLKNGQVRVLGTEDYIPVRKGEFTLTLPEGYYQLEVIEDRKGKTKGYTELFIESDETLIMDLEYVKPDTSEKAWTDFEDLKETAGEDRPESNPSPEVVGDLVMAEVASHAATQMLPENTIGLGLIAKVRDLQLNDNTDDPVEEEIEQTRSILWYPSFNNIPLVEELRKMSESYIVPGLEKMPNNTITLVATNRRFVESFLIGANHEMASELLWREFPTDRRGSYFQQFWDPSNYIPTKQDIKKAQAKYEKSREEDTQNIPSWEKLSVAARQREVIRYLVESPKYKDISPLHTWKLDSILGQHKPNSIRVSKTQDQTVLLMRGDLLSRFPNALIFLVEGIAIDESYDRCVPRLKEYIDQEIEEGNEFVPQDLSSASPIFPSFNGNLPPDTTYLMFNISPERIKTNKAQKQAGYFLVFEERVASARFGLDENTNSFDGEDEGGTPDFWNDLSWDHFSADGSTFTPGMYLNDLEPNAAFKELVSGQGDYNWNKSSARIAQATLQKHVRVSIHVDRMIPG